MQRVLCISVDRDAFGFDALSNDRMFRKKSTPSAIADIGRPEKQISWEETLEPAGNIYHLARLNKTDYKLL